MNLQTIGKNWEDLAKADPYWAVLSWHKKKQNKWGKEEFFQTGEREIMETLDQAAKLKPVNFGKALDFGCGLGRLTEALAGRFTEAVGVDISETMVRKAKELSRHANAEYVLNKADNLGVFPGNSFDFIYTRLTLQHMPPAYAKKYLKEFARILKPGGVLVFIAPGRQGTSFANLRKIKSISDLANLILPDWALNLARYAIGLVKNFPVMEMHSISLGEMTKYLSRLSLKTLQVSEFGKLNFGWVSWRYIVSK